MVYVLLPAAAAFFPISRKVNNQRLYLPRILAAVPYIHNVGKQVQKLQNSTLMDRNRRKWYTVQKTSEVRP